MPQESSRILRVFPRKTKATPDDPFVRIGKPKRGDDADEIQISVSFTWDKERAEQLAELWRSRGKVSIDGPAYDNLGAYFNPGEYLKQGYVITSRGCNNACSFCMAWRREGKLRELPITEGFNVLDNNLLQCSRAHIEAVFTMLARQSEKARFTGGLEAARLEPWHVDWLVRLKPEVIYLAYDEPSDYEPLRRAARLLKEAGLISGKHRVRAFVLSGLPEDSLEKAEERVTQVCRLGIMPMAMVFRGITGDPPSDAWRQWQRGWARPIIVGARMKSIKTEI